MSKTKKKKNLSDLELSLIKEKLINGNANVITVDKLASVAPVLALLKSFNVQYQVFGSSIYMNAANLIVMKNVGTALANTNFSYIFYHVSNPLGSELRTKNIAPLKETDIKDILLID